MHIYPYMEEKPASWNRITATYNNDKCIAKLIVNFAADIHLLYYIWLSGSFLGGVLIR